MQQPEPESQLIDLRDLLTLLRRRKRSIALVTILITVLAVGVVAWRMPVYTSLAQVEVRPLTIDEQLQPFASDSFVNMDTEAARVTQEPVARLAARVLDLDPKSPSDLTGATEDVDVTVQANTTFLEISCTQASSDQARLCAASFAAAYIQDRVENARNLYAEKVEAEQQKIQQANDQIKLLSDQLDQLGEEQEAAMATIQAQIDTQSQLIAAAQTYVLSLPTASPDAAVLARSADLPPDPSNKDYLLTGVLALIFGMALGIGLALVRERLAEPVASAESLEHTLRAPVLAVVPQVAAWRGKRLTRPVSLSAPEGPASQAYKTARTTLLQLGSQVIAVTAPGQGEGKTVTTANLAVVLAQSGKRVVAVSCDLRQPRLHRLFDRSNDVGLTSVLVGEARLSDVLHETEVPGLAVIASGPVSEDPAESLGGDDMSRILDDLRTRFDFVLLDTAPSLLVADAISLVPLTDGVIVVAHAGKTRRVDVSHLRRQFERVGGAIVGGIINIRASRRAELSYPYYVRPDYYLRPDEETTDISGKSEWSELPTVGSEEEGSVQAPSVGSPTAEVSAAGPHAADAEDQR